MDYLNKAKEKDTNSEGIDDTCLCFEFGTIGSLKVEMY